MKRHAAIMCGSRDWDVQSVIKRAIDGLPPGTVVLHGAAPGADHIAGIMADLSGLTVIPMPARWNDHGKAAGPRRNGEMLKVLMALSNCGYTCEVHAFLLPQSRGTRHMMHLAHRFKFIVWVHHPDGSVERYNKEST